MVYVLLSILAVSAIAAGLATLLVVAQRYITDYGECTITINDGKKLKVKGGLPLLEALAQNKIFIPSACGGRGTCAFCKLKVLEGGGPVVPTEEPYLDAAERQAQIRLSCQVKVRNDLRIRIPEELLDVKEYRCLCTRVRDLTHDIKEFRLDLAEPPEIAYRPGQYVQLFSPPYDGNEAVCRAYSIASDPADRRALELVIRLVPGGICTTWCFQHLVAGREVRVSGPFGEFGLSGTGAPMIMVAGGSGMAPMRCLLHHLRNSGDPRPATFFFGANRVKELFSLDEMAEFAKSLPAFEFVPVVAKPDAEEQWSGEAGLVTEALARRFRDLAGHEGYLCGSPGMIDAAIAVLKKLGMPEDKIFYDKF